MKERHMQVLQLWVLPPEKNSLFGLLDVCSSLSGPFPTEVSLPHTFLFTGFPPTTSYKFVFGHNSFSAKNTFLEVFWFVYYSGVQQSFQEGRYLVWMFKNVKVFHTLWDFWIQICRILIKLAVLVRNIPFFFWS